MGELTDSQMDEQTTYHSLPILLLFGVEYTGQLWYDNQLVTSKAVTWPQVLVMEPLESKVNSTMNRTPPLCCAAVSTELNNKLVPSLAVTQTQVPVMELPGVRR